MLNQHNLDNFSREPHMNINKVFHLLGGKKKKTQKTCQEICTFDKKTCLNTSCTFSLVKYIFTTHHAPKMYLYLTSVIPSW